LFLKQSSESALPCNSEMGSFLQTFPLNSAR